MLQLFVSFRGSTRLFASVSDMLFPDLDRPADPPRYVVGTGATTTFVVADHVLLNVEFVSELGRRQTGLDGHIGMGQPSMRKTLCACF